MAEAMNYSKSRKTQENKDLLKTINDSLDNDGVIDSKEAKLINEKYKNLKSTTLAISKNELGNLAKGLGLNESSNLFKTINKLKEISNRVGFTPDLGPTENIDPGFTPDLGPTENIDPGFTPDLGPTETLEIPSEIEIQRKKNIKQTILEGFKEKGIDFDSFGGVSGIDFDGDDKEPYLEMVNDFVDKLNKMEKKNGVFLKNSVLKNLIQTKIFDYLQNANKYNNYFTGSPKNTFFNSLDGFVDNSEKYMAEKLFAGETYFLLQNPDNFQTEEDIFRENKGLTEGRGGNATGLRKDPSDNRRRIFHNGGGTNSGFSGGGDGNGGNDPRRRIKKGEKWTSNKNGIDGIKSNNENSKYGITSETRKKVNEKLIELGMKPAEDKEINETEHQSNTIKENNNIDRIIKEIKSNRAYEKKEDIRRVKSGFDEKEYYYDNELMEKYSKNFNKPIQSIHDAISSIFTKHNSDGLGRYIKKDDMIKLLEEYFKINDVIDILPNIIETDENGNPVNKPEFSGILPNIIETDENGNPVNKPDYSIVEL